MNHFIFSLKWRLSNVSSIIARSLKSKKYILLILILSIQSDFRSIDMWFFEKMTIEVSCSFHTLNSTITARNFLIIFWLSYTVTSFDNLNFSFARLNWTTSTRELFVSRSRSTYVVKISFLSKDFFDFRSRRRFIENSFLLSSRC